MKYKKGYNYQLNKDHWLTIPVIPEKDIITDYILFDNEGLLVVREGYAWDGASRVPDFKFFMESSLVHDALYQLMREALLDIAHRSDADWLFAEMSCESLSHKLKPKSKRILKQILKPIIYWVLQTFGGKSATKDNIKKIVEV